MKKRISEAVISEIDFSKEVSDEDISAVIDDRLIEDAGRFKLSYAEVIKLKSEIFNSIKRFDVIQEFLENEDVTEIMINGKDDIFVEENGVLTHTGKSFESEDRLEDIIQQMVGGCNRTVNEANPIADARLSTGERVNIVLAPVALNGPIVTIRRFPKNPITMERLIKIGSLSPEAADFLKLLVRCKFNIFISGGTGSGKTTFLNALSQYIPRDERIITIEDSAELQLLNAENLVRLETRGKNAEDCEPITIRDLIRASLRMRPERIIVGEVRGPEALDMLQAMNTGHDGSLSTGHANSTRDMLSRLETMILTAAEIPIYAIRSQIAGGIDILIHLGRMRDRSRRVLEISEVVGMENGEITLNMLFKRDGSDFIKCGRLIHTEKLERALSEEEFKKIKNGL